MGRFKMWYTSFVNDKVGTSYAESDDGVLWDTAVVDGQVLTPTDGSWDSDGIETVSVLEQDDGCGMWFYRYPATLPAGEQGRHQAIDMATSTDGIVWVEYPDIPVFEAIEEWESPYTGTVVENGTEFTFTDGGVLEPSIVWDEEEEELYRLWYAGTTLQTKTVTEDGVTEDVRVKVSQIGSATSPDGVTWDKGHANPVFTPLGSAGSDTWENPFRVDHANVVVDLRGGLSPLLPLRREPTVHRSRLQRGRRHVDTGPGKPGR